MNPSNLTVFLVDVDDTLLDNDHIQKDLKLHIGEQFGHRAQHQDLGQRRHHVDQFPGALHERGHWIQDERRNARVGKHIRVIVQAAASLGPAVK